MNKIIKAILIGLITVGCVGLSNPTAAAVNRPPTASAQNVVTSEDTAVVITLSGSDPEGASLSYQISRNPNRGSISCSGARCTYSPTTNLNGADSFTFTVNDGSATSRPATVSISVQSVNDAPTIEVAAVRLAEDAAVNIRPTRRDVDGDATTLRIVTNPTHGTAIVSGDLILYSPTANYNGSDSIGVVADDGRAVSTTGTIALTIDAVNDAPTANNQAVVTNEDTAIAIPLSVSDVDGNTLTVSFGYQSHNGTVSADNSVVTYTPTSGYSGSDSFTYRVTDGSAWSSTATVDITVNAVNDAPVAEDAQLTLLSGQTRIIDLNATDTDGTIASYQLLTPVHLGQTELVNHHLSYRATTLGSGTETIDFVAVDDNGERSASASISVTVLPSDTVVPIQLSDLEPLEDVSIDLTSNQITTSFPYDVCYDTTATPLVVPVELTDGSRVDAIVFMMHSKCPNTTALLNAGVLVLTSDGSAWRFIAEGEQDLRPDAMTTGSYDPVGVLSYPLYFTRNDSGDADAMTGGYVQYQDGAMIFSDFQAGRPYSAAVVNLDGIIPLLTINPYVPTCQTDHKIDAEHCGVFVFINQLNQAIADQAYQVDNGFEAWGTAGSTRVQELASDGTTISDYWLFGTGPAANMGEATTIDGGCQQFYIDTAAVRAAVLTGSFSSFDLFQHSYDPGSAGCVGLNTNANSVLAGSAIQGEAVVNLDPNTNEFRVWVKGYEPDVEGSSETRIAVTDLTGTVVCETLVNSGVSRNPFNGVNTGMVVDQLGNGYTNVDYYDTNGVLRTGILQIDPTSCATNMLVDLTSALVGGSMSGLTLAEDTAGNHLVLGVVGTSLYSYDIDHGTTTTYAFSDGTKEFAAAPVLDASGNVAIIAKDNTVFQLHDLSLNYGDHLWPRFRKDNFGSATLTLLR